MTNDKYHLLDQIYSRLCFHCSIAPERVNHKREKFIASLACYPEDLLCAAYHHVSHRLMPAQLPSEDEFIAFMAPEFHRRQLAECMEAL